MPSGFYVIHQNIAQLRRLSIFEFWDYSLNNICIFVNTQHYAGGYGLYQLTKINATDMGLKTYLAV